MANNSTDKKRAIPGIEEMTIEAACDAFSKNKQSITLEDCKVFINRFFPEDKTWFKDMATEIIPYTDRDGKAVKKIIPWMTVKKNFLDRYEKHLSEDKYLKAINERKDAFKDW